jgi:2-dehydropantoate 2-reductase
MSAAMRIAIIGAGAIGGWIGVRLAKAGNAVSVLARGATLAAIQKNGWTLRSADGDDTRAVAASDDPAALGEQDLVVLALKGPALPSVAPSLLPLIGPETVVVPAMNGVPWWFMLGDAGEASHLQLDSVDPGGVIAASIPARSIIGSVVHASASVEAPGITVHKAGNGIILGEPGGTISARLDAVATIFEAAGFDVTRSTDIRRDIWYKLWGNLTMNPISALTGATCDRILDDPLVRGFVLSCMAEAQAIGNRIGCTIDQAGEDRILVTRKLGAFKTSMLQDAENGRPLEIDQLLAAPREIAQALGIATPSLDALLGLTRQFAISGGLYPPLNVADATSADAERTSTSR